MKGVALGDSVADNIGMKQAQQYTLQNAADDILAQGTYEECKAEADKLIRGFADYDWAPCDPYLPGAVWAAETTADWCRPNIIEIVPVS